MNGKRRGELEALSLEVRKDIVRMVGLARAAGLASSLAVANLLVYMYWEQMKVYPDERNRGDRDRLVMSHASAAAALYACLARKGYFDREELWSYRRLGATLQGFPDIRTPGVDAPNGACGGGLGIASGLCIALRLDGLASRVYCVLGQDELRKGVMWESVRSAAINGLGHLAAIIDVRDGSTSGDGIASGLDAFGWLVCDADGRDFDSIDAVFSGFDYEDPRPKAILAVTGVDGGLMSLRARLEDSGRPMSGDEIDNALSLLEQQSNVRADHR
ncbi:MAG: transketolase [Synergistaceae bacterium]|nr:transketolase [Synergistaceae bacterium]